MEYSREVVDLIVQMVLDRLQAANDIRIGQTKRIIALFFAGMKGAEEARDAVLSLCEQGHSVSAMFSERANIVNGPEWLKAKAPRVQVIDIDHSITTAPIIALLKETDIVLIPILTCNSLSKLAHGIADNPLLTVAMFALFRGIPVIAAENACSMAESTRYSAILNQNRKTLANAGIKFVPATSLVQIIQCSDFASVGTPAALNSETALFEKPVLSVTDIREWTGKILKVLRKTIVTPAAYDAAGQRGIRIVCVERAE